MLFETQSTQAFDYVFVVDADNIHRFRGVHCPTANHKALRVGLDFTLNPGSLRILLQGNLHRL